MGSKLAAKVAELALEVVKDTALCSAGITINNLLFNSLFNHSASFDFFFNWYTLHYFAGCFVCNFLGYANSVLFGLGFGHALLDANLDFNLLLNLLANLYIHLGWNAFGYLFHLGDLAFFPYLVGNPALDGLGLGSASIFALGFAAIILLEFAKKAFQAISDAGAARNFPAFPMTFVYTLLNSGGHWLASGDFLHNGAFFAGLDPFTYGAGFFLHFVHPPVYIAGAGAFFFDILALVGGIFFFNALFLVHSPSGFIILGYHYLAGDSTGCWCSCGFCFFSPNDVSRRGHEEARQQCHAGSLPKHALLLGCSYVDRCHSHIRRP